MSGSNQGRLQEEIDELRGELRNQAVTRGSELKDQAVTLGSGLKDEAVMRGGEFKDQAVDTADWLRETVSRTPKDRWATLGSAGLALIALIIIIRRLRTR